MLVPYIPPKGVRVDKLVIGAPAHAAGLRQGDEIVAVDGHAVSDNKTLNQAVSKADTPGARVHMRVRSAATHEEKDVTVTKVREDDIRDRQRMTELFLALSDATQREVHAKSLVEESQALWLKMCAKDDEVAGSLTTRVVQMQRNMETTCLQLRDELARVQNAPSPSPSGKIAKESLHEQLMISDDLAEMLALKESELADAHAKAAELQAQLIEAQMQLSVSTRFAHSREALSPAGSQSFHSPHPPSTFHGSPSPMISASRGSQGGFF